jgi:hypothetical protein
VLAFGFPADGSGGFVECDDELDIGAIAVEDEEILEEYGRATGAVAVIVFEFAVGPDDVAGGIEAGGAMGAEVDVDAIFFEDGCGGSVAVFTVDGAGVLEFEDDDIMKQLTGVAVEGECVEGFAVIDGGGEPELLSEDCGGGPA